MTWAALTDPLLLVKLVWCLTALATMAMSVRVWWRLRSARRSSAGRAAPPSVRVWAQALVNATGSQTLVATCNLAAGLISLTIPPTPATETHPGAFLIPALFIVSALLKFRSALALDRGYWRATRVGA